MDSGPGNSVPASATTVAAIDVGANALRMVIAEVLPDGRIESGAASSGGPLGQDTFRRGRLGGESMRAAIAVLRDYRKSLDLYNVEKIRAVATTAVREATNGDTFLDRVFMATRLNVEVIDTSEESRLTVSAVRQAVGDSLGVNQRHTLIADVGGGSTLLTVLEDGEIDTSQSLRLGSIRLQEIFSTSEESPRQSADLLAAAHREHAFDVRERRAAGRDRLVRGRRRRCPVRRPRSRHAHRIERIGGDRRRRLRPSRRSVASATRPRNFQTARPSLRRGRNPQSRLAGLSAAFAQNEGQADDRVARSRCAMACSWSWRAK